MRQASVESKSAAASRPGAVLLIHVPSCSSQLQWICDAAAVTTVTTAV